MRSDSGAARPRLRAGRAYRPLLVPAFARSVTAAEMARYGTLVSLAGLAVVLVGFTLAGAWVTRF